MSQHTPRGDQPSSVDHTRGPWTAAEIRLGYDQIIRGADQGPVALVQLAGYTKGTAAANARLIAAAPNLLDALEACLKEYEARTWTDPASGGPSAAARAALRQARGEG